MNHNNFLVSQYQSYVYHMEYSICTIAMSLKTKSSSIQSLSRVQFFVTPWTAAHQASLPITNSRSLLKLMSIQLVIPSNHLILCHPLLLCLQSFPASGSFPVSWLFPFPSPGDIPNPGIKPESPTLAGRFSTSEPPRKFVNRGSTYYFRVVSTPGRSLNI